MEHEIVTIINVAKPNQFWCNIASAIRHDAHLHPSGRPAREGSLNDQFSDGVCGCHEDIDFAWDVPQIATEINREIFIEYVQNCSDRPWRCFWFHHIAERYREAVINVARAGGFGSQLVHAVGSLIRDESYRCTNQSVEENTEPEPSPSVYPIKMIHTFIESRAPFSELRSYC